MKRVKTLYTFIISLILVVGSISNIYGQEKTEKSTKSDPNVPIFEVKNDLGQTVFAVYPGGVKIFVAETQLKATGGGFTVGRIGTEKATGGDIFSVLPNNVEVIIDETISGLKATGGGFTVGRIGTEKAAGDTEKFFTVTPDSTRVYIDETSTAGFAVGKIGTTTGLQNFMHLKKENYFIGHNSGKLTTGLYNLFLGYESGLANTTGESNTFLGFQSGYSNTTGINNVFIGNQSGFSNLNGDYNTFIGYQSGNKTTGGTETWEGASNTFLGYRAGFNNTTGHRNIAIGYNAGFGLTSNRYNVIIGEQSGYNLSTGQANVWLGTYAGQYNNGSSNIFIGLDAGWYNQSGSDNVYIGVGAGRNGEGSGNVYIGNHAGLSMVRDNTLLIENSTNITTPLIFGNFTSDLVGINNIAPSANLHIKQIGTGEEGLAIENDGNANVWAWEIGTNDLSLSFNGTNVGYWDDATGNYVATSDSRLKKDIAPLDEFLLDKVEKLKVVSYRLKHADDKSKKSIGFIAQDVQLLFPDLVKQNDNGFLGLNYADFGVIAIKAIQEQQKQIEELKEKNNTLSQQVSEIDALKAEMTELKAMVKEIAGATKESKSESAK